MIGDWYLRQIFKVQDARPLCLSSMFKMTPSECVRVDSICTNGDFDSVTSEWIMWVILEGRRRRRAHPHRCSTDSSVGHLSVPGCPGTPGILAAPQLLQQRQSPPAAPPWDGCGPIYRPGYEHMDTIMCRVYNCLQITDRSNHRYTNLKAQI